MKQIITTIFILGLALVVVPAPAQATYCTPTPIVRACMPEGTDLDPVLQDGDYDGIPDMVEDAEAPPMQDECMVVNGQWFCLPVKPEVGAVDGDHDNDGSPDDVESALCGRQGMRDTLPILGITCYSSTDASPIDAVGTATALVSSVATQAEPVIALLTDAGAGAVEIVLAQVEGVRQLAIWIQNEFWTLYRQTVQDWDYDMIPDALEPTLCTWQDDTLWEDGVCLGGGDYDPWLI